MAVNDLTLLNGPAFGTLGTIKYKVAASATVIYPGEPVVAAGQGANGYVVAHMATNKPSVGTTDLLIGVAMSQSTNTAAAVGYVEVLPMLPGQIWLISPKVAATWDTQAEYDALVGAAVLLDLSSDTIPVYTILASNGAAYGCVITPLDISAHPGKVAFRFKDTLSFYSIASA
jgi:hypothetical protein